MRCPNFMVEEDDHEKIVIRDIGPWDEFPTVTNNAEAVIEKLGLRGEFSRHGYDGIEPLDVPHLQQTAGSPGGTATAVSGVITSR